MTDKWLSRIVAVGLILLALVTVAAYSYLKANGQDPSDVVALAGAAVGALAGFLTGVRLSDNG